MRRRHKVEARALATSLEYPSRYVDRFTHLDGMATSSPVLSRLLSEVRLLLAREARALLSSVCRASRRRSGYREEGRVRHHTGRETACGAAYWV